MEIIKIERSAIDFIAAVDVLNTNGAHTAFEELFLSMGYTVKEDSFDEAVFAIREAVSSNFQKATGSIPQGGALPELSSAEKEVIEEMREYLLPQNLNPFLRPL